MMEELSKIILFNQHSNETEKNETLAGEQLFCFNILSLKAKHTLFTTTKPIWYSTDYSCSL